MSTRIVLLLSLCLFPLAAFAQEQVPVKVVVFMSPTCPICQYYTSDLIHYQSLFEGEQVEWKLVFPGKVGRKEIRTFMAYYNLDLPWKKDRRYKLTREAGVNRTPEVAVYQEDRLVYRGAIDNAWEDLGQQRGSITQYPLRKLLYIATNSKLGQLIETEAVGCLIEGVPQK